MNTYLEEIIKLGINVDPDREPWERLITSRRYDMGQMTMLFTQRRKMTKRYAWAIPDDAAIKCLREYAPLIEIGAGKGYWASMLDCDIVCFDKQAGMLNQQTDNGHSFYLVSRGGTEQIVKHPLRTLFLCWPPYSDSMAAECLIAYEGDRFIFIGEGDGGCTGDDRFWSILNKGWEIETSLRIPQWDGINDMMMVYRRNSG